MITIAAKEIYKLDIKIGVSGDKESSSKIKKVEETTEKAEKKMKSLDRVTASPTARLRDQLTSPLTKLEGKINSFAAAATKRLIAFGTAASVALGGIGAVSTVKTFANWEASMSNVKALTGATADELDKLADKSKELGARTSKTAKEAADAMSYQALAGWNVNQIMSSTEPILRLSEAANSDLAHTSDLVTDSMSSLGVQTEQLGRYLDIVAQTQASANTTADGMLEAYIEAGGMFKSFNTPLEESAALIGVLANRGIKASEAGHSLNSLLINLMGTTSRTSEALQQLGVKAYDENGNFRGVETTLRDVKEAMSGLTDEQEDMLSANLGGKTQITTLKALLSGLGEEYDTLKTKVTNSDGALNRMAETMQDNLKGQWTRLKSAVEGAQIELGEKLAPYMKQFVTWFTNKIPEIKDGIMSTVDYLSKNTDKLITLGKTAVTVTGSIMALSLASKTLGAINGVTGFISSVRAIQTGAEAATSSLSLAGLAAKVLPAIFNPVGLAITAGVAATIYGVKSYNSLMSKSIDTATEDLTFGEKIINKFTGSAYKSAKELQESGIKYTDFGKGISDSFKEAARETAKSGTELLMNVKKIDIGGSSFSDKENRIANRINDYAYDIINAVENRKKSESEAIKTALSADDDYSAENDSAISSIGKYYDGVTEKIQIARDKIYEITSQAYSNNRELAANELEEIKGYIDQMNSLKLEALESKNTYDLAYAKSKFETDASKITDTNSASELLKNSYKEIDETYRDKIADLDGNIAVLEKTLSGTTDESEKASLQNSINELMNARDSYTTSNWDEKQSMYKIIMDQNPGAANSINKYTGDKVDGSELDDREIMQRMIDSHLGASNIKESGNYTLFNDLTKQWENVTIAVDEYSKEITGFYNESTNKGAAYSNSQREQLDTLRKSYSDTTDGIINAIDVITNSTLNTDTGEFKMGNAIVASLEDIQRQEDGVITGMTTINGTQVYIKADATGAIEAIANTREELDQVPPVTTADISTNASEATGEVGGLLENLREIGSKVWTGVVNITKNVTEAFTSSNGEGHTAGHKEGYASGTDNATAGLHPVAEEGFEIITNPSVRNFRGGEKVLNHNESVEFLKNQGKIKQGTYQVAQPQVQFAGGGNIDMGGININVDGNQNVEAMINQAMLQFGNTLRQAFSNIKK